MGQIKDTHGDALNVTGNDTFGNSRGIIIELSHESRYGSLPTTCTTTRDADSASLRPPAC